MNAENFKDLEKQFKEFSEQDKENNSVLLIVGDKDEQRIFRVGTPLNIATMLAVAMANDDCMRKVFAAAVEAYNSQD